MSSVKIYSKKNRTYRSATIKAELLVAMPYFPQAGNDLYSLGMRRFLKALPRDWETTLSVATYAPQEITRLKNDSQKPNLRFLEIPDSFFQALKHSISKSHYKAILFLDHPLTRPSLRKLAYFAPHIPIILVALPHRPMENPSKVESIPGAARDWPAPLSEIWNLGGALLPLYSDDFLPRAGIKHGSINAAWLKKNIVRLSKSSTVSKTHGKDKNLASIIIPCWNGLRYTKECVESVLKHTDTPFELIVVDNGSQDGTSRYVRSLKDRRIRLIQNSLNLGFAKAINQGMRAAKGRYFVWLNSDTIVTPNWLKRMTHLADRAPWVGGVGPYTNSGPQPQIMRIPYNDLRALPAFSEAWAMQNSGKAKWTVRLAGFCFLVKKEVVRKIGLLDERFGLGCYEDYDFCLRIRQAGYSLYIAEDAFVHHHGHKTFEHNGISDSEAARQNREVFIEKWCRRSLEFLDDIEPAISSPLELNVRSRSNR